MSTRLARPIDLSVLRLGKGSHSAVDLTDAEKAAGEQACVMEAVAAFAGEPWSDRPQCASVVLSSYGIGLNDVLPDDRRQELVPLIPRLVGTRDGQDKARSYLALDWLIRVYTPAWLRLVPALVSDADAIAGMPRIQDLESAAAIGDMVRAASTKAAAAGDAARAAAGDAARAAAGVAARAAAGVAAWDAAWDAARAAAWDAARAAAGAAAGDAALAPTVTELQTSAIALFDRMIDPAS